MGSYVSIYNDTDDSVKVWFQLLGGAPPIGGYGTRDLPPDTQADHLIFTLMLVMQVAAEYRERRTGPTKTKYLRVWSPLSANEHKIVKVNEIIGTKEIAAKNSEDTTTLNGEWKPLLSINPGDQEMKYEYQYEQGIQYDDKTSMEKSTKGYFELQQSVTISLGKMSTQFGSSFEFVKSAVESAISSQRETIKSTLKVPAEGMSYYQWTMKGLYKGHPITIYTNKFSRLKYGETPPRGLE